MSEFDTGLIALKQTITKTMDILDVLQHDLDRNRQTLNFLMGAQVTVVHECQRFMDQGVNLDYWEGKRDQAEFTIRFLQTMGISRKLAEAEWAARQEQEAKDLELARLEMQEPDQMSKGAAHV